MKKNKKNAPSTWKKIINFAIELLKLVVAAFLGGSVSSLS